MKKLTVIAGVILLALFTSCLKIKDNHIYILSGHLFNDCSMTPVANKEISLYQSVSGGVISPTYGGKILANATTDANGYFQFKYKDDGGSVMEIQYKAGAGYNSIMEEIPKQTTDENLVLYLNPTTNIQVSLNVINPHTVNDTLHITDYNNLPNDLVIPGPFFSQTLYSSVFNLYTMTYKNNNFYNGVGYINVGYKINTANYSLKKVTVTPCENENVVVDIN